MTTATALANSVAWYRSVMAAHGIGDAVGEHFWSTNARVPPYYSNLVTRTRDGVDEQLARLEELARVRPAPEWGLKDSFDALPAGRLQALGLRELFAASWYGLSPSDHPGAPESDLNFEPVTDAETLAAWEAAWQRTSPAPGLRVFPETILADASVTFLTAHRDGRAIGGLIANLSDGAVGVSNLHAAEGEDGAAIARDAVGWLRERHPGRAVVGYAQDGWQSILAPLGFRALGPLRVWLAS